MKRYFVVYHRETGKEILVTRFLWLSYAVSYLTSKNYTFESYPRYIYDENYKGFII